MKSATAIKTWVQQGSSRKVTLPELLELKNATDPAEWEQMGRDSCEMLGEEFEPTK